MKKLIIFAVVLTGCFQSPRYDCTKTNLDKTLKIYDACIKKVEDFVQVHNGRCVYNLEPACMQQAKELTCIPIVEKWDE